MNPKCWLPKSWLDPQSSPWLYVIIVLIVSKPLALWVLEQFNSIGIQITWLIAVSAWSLLILLLTIICRVPIWWWFINASFPWMLEFALGMQWSPNIFLIMFAVLWLFYGGLTPSRVPFYPTQKALYPLIEKHLPIGAARVLDIGSGFGSWCFLLQQRRPDFIVTGIELSLLPWLVSYLRAWLQGFKCQFLQGDYRHLDWAAYDVVYAYLSPLVMNDVWQQACKQMRSGSLLISYEFNVTAASVSTLVNQSDFAETGVYIWRMLGDNTNGSD